MNTLSFDIYGDLGHFKKYYTTSSPLTFSFPPPPTIRGMLGAIVGAGKQEYLEIFSHEKCRLAIELRSQVNKIRMGLNHINTKGNYWIPTKKGKHEARTQIRTEFVKNPVYRIYVTHNDEGVFWKLAENVMAHKTVYTLSLGLSELLADFRFVALEEFEKRQEGPCKISTVTPMSLIKSHSVELEQNKKYIKEKLPIEMTRGRVVNRYESVIFEAGGDTIKAWAKHFWENKKGECIVFF